jgi:hypothetical protein
VSPLPAAEAAAPAAATPGSAGRRRRGASAASGIYSALKAHAPSLDPTPSPLRRITRSMRSPLGSPVLDGEGATRGAGGAAEDEAADADGGSGSSAGMFAGRVSDGSLTSENLGLTEGLEAAAAAAAAAAAGGGSRTRRSSLNRFDEQQNRWGLVPGQDDTLDINMNVPGVGGLRGVAGRIVLVCVPCAGVAMRWCRHALVSPVV